MTAEERAQRYRDWAMEHKHREWDEIVAYVASEFREAEAAAMERAAAHKYDVDEPARYDEYGVEWTDTHWRAWLRAEAARVRAEG